jgi:hypothetical protein
MILLLVEIVNVSIIIILTEGGVGRFGMSNQGEPPNMD